jgi:hypothetical protein
VEESLVHHRFDSRDVTKGYDIGLVRLAKSALLLVVSKWRTEAQY